MNDVYYAVAHRSQEEIDSFPTRYNNFDTSTIQHIFREVLSEEVINISQSDSWGSSHVVYFVDVKGTQRRYVFRANTGFNREPEYVMLTEKLITDAVQKIGIPTNIVLFADISRKKYPFDYQIQHVIKGSDLEDHFHGTKDEYDRLSYDLGTYLAKLHSIVIPGFGRFDVKSAKTGKLAGSKKSFYDYITVCLDEDLHYLKSADVIKPKTAKQIATLFEEYKPIINVNKGVLVHHDLADHNIMFKNNQITGIFDWEAAVVGDPVLDIASCPTWRTHHPREEMLIEGYTSISKLPDRFWEKMNIYRLRTMLWKMVYAIRADILNNTRIEKFNDSLAPFKLLS